MAVKRTAYDVEEIKIEGLEPTPEMKELLEKKGAVRSRRKRYGIFSAGEDTG